MKKLFCLFVFCNLALNGMAFSVGDLFIKNSRFWQNQVSVDMFETNSLSAGFIFDFTKHDDRKDKIYAFHLPFEFNFNLLNLTIDPFWYPNSNDASAYGGNIKLEGLLKNDNINNIYVGGYLKAGFANQKANIARGIPQSKENFKEWVFESGLNFYLANLYNFNINGNIFSYPDKVKNITFFGGIMNQNDLADLGTIDYILNFPEFSAGGNITWISPENNTKTYLGYKYINYEQNLIAHSIMLKTIIPITERVLTVLIYNHVIEKHNKNKDLFGVGLNFLF